MYVDSSEAHEKFLLKSKNTAKVRKTEKKKRKFLCSNQMKKNTHGNNK